uniref:Uncharacterized protein n=1 Tax=Anopheles christyi TaxID=43041 RepID=A0A182KAJ5_9DIPT
MDTATDTTTTSQSRVMLRSTLLPTREPSMWPLCQAIWSTRIPNFKINANEVCDMGTGFGPFSTGSGSQVQRLLVDGMPDKGSLMDGTTRGGQIASLLLDWGSIHGGVRCSISYSWDGMDSSIGVGHSRDGIAMGSGHIWGGNVRRSVSGDDVLRGNVLLNDRGLRYRVGQRNGVRRDRVSFGGNGQSDNDCNNDALQRKQR